MISTTWTMSPADLHGPGNADVCVSPAPVMDAGPAVRPGAPFAVTAQFGGTRVPVAGGAIRLRSVLRQVIGHDVVTKKSFENNGTTLGIHSSRRPKS